VNTKLISTPVGAILGIALTKKMYEKPNNFQLAGGAAVGGGLGYVAGDLYDANPLSLVSSDNPAQNRKKLDEYLEDDIRTGAPGAVEKTTLSKGYNTFPDKGILTNDRVRKRTHETQRNYLAIKNRMNVYKKLADKATADGRSDDATKYTNAYTANEKNLSSYNAKETLGLPTTRDTLLGGVDWVRDLVR